MDSGRSEGGSRSVTVGSARLDIRINLSKSGPMNQLERRVFFGAYLRTAYYLQDGGMLTSMTRDDDGASDLPFRGLRCESAAATKRMPDKLSHSIRVEGALGSCCNPALISPNWLPPSSTLDGFRFPGPSGDTAR